MTSSTASMAQPDSEIIRALDKAGLIVKGQAVYFEQLAGGVSSDIWKVESGGHVFCVKRALAKLKVEADWRAPVERNRFEVAWYRIAGSIIPGSAPRVLFHDKQAMLCAMEYLDPATHRLWKSELRAGRGDPRHAHEVGRRLSVIHAATAGDEQVAEQFTRIDIFQAIRLQPYLEATSLRHPDLSEELQELSLRTAAVRTAMIHGDVSPKNILIGPNGPVFIDAECACMCDPAFDLAFCLNHFLLKCLWTPSARRAFVACFEAMSSAYLAGVTWEDADVLEARAASLLPALFLARIDGNSPVEYVTDEADKTRVRRCARPLIKKPPARLSEVLQAWREELGK